MGKTPKTPAPAHMQPVPEGYFWRVRKDYDEYRDHFTVLELRRERRRFGSKRLWNSAPILNEDVTPEELARLSVEIWDMHKRKQDGANYFGDYPPRRL